MAPEQAKGREADKRSDIWAFGCVLYEMLTGRRAFEGEDMTEVLGAVVRLEPNWEALPVRRAAGDSDAAATVPRQGSPQADCRHRCGALRARSTRAGRRGHQSGDRQRRCHAGPLWRRVAALDGRLR